jgi:multidrug efflux pump subunit AcrA (membrane-fusion protein)
MEIVPHESQFTIHARVSPMDIDALYPGLKAEVRIPVFDSARNFPSLYSELQDVSTDVYVEEQADEAYYKATLTIDDETMALLQQENLQLVSGMPVEVVIKTGERTLFNYLVKPLQDMVVRAFNEA